MDPGAACYAGEMDLDVSAADEEDTIYVGGRGRYQEDGGRYYLAMSRCVFLGYSADSIREEDSGEEDWERKMAGLRAQLEDST